MSDAQIRQALTSSGWSEQDIQQAMGGTVETLISSRPSRTHLWIGLGLLVLTVLGNYVYWNYVASGNISIWVSIYILVVLLLQSLILFILIKAFKVQDSHFGKALLFASVVGLAVIIYQSLSLLDTPSFVNPVIFLAFIIGWFALLMKLYSLSVGKGIGLGILHGIVTGILAVIIFFVFAFAGLLSFTRLFQTSLKNEQNMTQNTNLTASQPSSSSTAPISNQQTTSSSNELSKDINRQYYEEFVRVAPKDFPIPAAKTINYLDKWSNKELILRATSQSNMHASLTVYENYFTKNGWRVNKNPSFPNVIMGEYQNYYIKISYIDLAGNLSPHLEINLSY